MMKLRHSVKFTLGLLFNLIYFLKIALVTINIVYFCIKKKTNDFISLSTLVDVSLGKKLKNSQYIFIIFIHQLNNILNDK